MWVLLLLCMTYIYIYIYMYLYESRSDHSGLETHVRTYLRIWKRTSTQESPCTVFRCICSCRDYVQANSGSKVINTIYREGLIYYNLNVMVCSHRMTLGFDARTIFVHQTCKAIRKLSRSRWMANTITGWGVSAWRTLLFAAMAVNRL